MERLIRVLNLGNKTERQQAKWLGHIFSHSKERCEKEKKVQYEKESGVRNNFIREDK